MDAVQSQRSHVVGNVKHRPSAIRIAALSSVTFYLAPHAIRPKLWGGAPIRACGKSRRLLRRAEEIGPATSEVIGWLLGERPLDRLRTTWEF